MTRFFDDNLYRFESPQPSYWEATAATVAYEASPLETDERCDVAIIGGGYTGLSAALHLARDHGVDVRVLEAGHIGWGASGRNGGFCCPGGTAVHGADFLRLVGVEQARRYYTAQIEAVQLVRQLAIDEEIEYLEQGSVEVEVAHTARSFERLRRSVDIYRNTLGLDVELLSAEESRERFFDSTEQFGAMVMRPAFGLHPLRFCQGLAAAAARHGAHLHDRSEVREWSRDSDGLHRLVTRGATLSARRVVFATNGFMPEQLRPQFYGRTIPVISAIVVTRPLTADELEAQQWTTEHPIINSRHILNYFRLLPDRRFLFGGRGDVTGSRAGEQRTYANLSTLLGRIWPGWRNIEIQYRWHGLICTTASLRPSIGQTEDDPSVYFGFGYHGNGVNNATWTGQQLARWIASGKAPGSIPEMLLGLGKRYPVPALRRSYLRMILAIARQLDRFG
jgi:glycine/D-amino acid oxidase-like deaminating enzyme